MNNEEKCVYLISTDNQELSITSDEEQDKNGMSALSHISVPFS